MLRTCAKTSEKRSPLHHREIKRLPGQGLWESFFNERLAPIAIWSGMAMGILVSVVFDALLRLIKHEAFGWHMMLLLFVGFAMAAWSTRSEIRKARLERLGLEGEIAVAQSLESLTAFGCCLFHDLQPDAVSTNGVKPDGSGPNIDHVVVSRAGVFVIETKTRSKRVEGAKNAVVTFDGKRVLVDGFPPDRDPLQQARAATADVARYVERSTGLRTTFRPVVLFPGWFVQSVGTARESDVWVLNDNALRKWIEIEIQTSPVLDDAKVARIAESLSARCKWRPSPV